MATALLPPPHRLGGAAMKLVPKAATANRRIIELLDYDFGWMRALERARLRAMPAVSPVRVYDAMMKSRMSDISTMFAILEAIGCKCDDDEDAERCRVVRIVEVDDRGLIVDEHPSEG
jgi:hypothetical protein